MHPGWAKGVEVTPGARFPGPPLVIGQSCPREIGIEVLDPKDPTIGLASPVPVGWGGDQARYDQAGGLPARTRPKRAQGPARG